MIYTILLPVSAFLTKCSRITTVCWVSSVGYHFILLQQLTLIFICCSLTSKDASAYLDTERCCAGEFSKYLTVQFHSVILVCSCLSVSFEVEKCTMVEVKVR